MALAISFPVDFLRISSTRTRELKQSSPAQPCQGGRRTYDRVLPDALKETLATLLSPPRCHAAFSTVPHTLASVD
jgi:hypothetical protein